MLLQAIKLLNHNKTTIFTSGAFVTKNLEETIAHNSIAWKYTPELSLDGYRFLYILAKKRPLQQFSSDEGKYISLSDQIEAHMKALATSRVDTSTAELEDVVPLSVLSAFYHERELAMNNLQKTTNFGEDYEALHRAHILSETISQNRLSISSSNYPHYIKYDIFGTATGRLATSPGSFPILTLGRDQRSLLRPQNDLFVELDLNSAEIRMLLALSGAPQPPGDIHRWNLDNITNKTTTRQKMKEIFFAWLYNPSMKDALIEKYYNRNAFLHYWSNGVLKTPYGREMEVDQRKALNYLLQSTTSDMVLENVYKILTFLKDKKSFISFTMHDSVVLDFDRTEHAILKDIKFLFESGRFGKFPCSVAIGKNYAEMREVEI